jgi:hypothetical protein
MYMDSIELETNFLLIREVSLEDVSSIIEIRLSRKDSVLSPIQVAFEDQKTWLKKYLLRRSVGEEYYFKLASRVNSDKIIGLMRLTEISDATKRFSWESFIMTSDSHPSCTIDAIIIAYSLGFLFFQKDVCGPWIVPARAERIQKLHKAMGIAVEINANDSRVSFKVERQKFLEKRDFYNKHQFGLSDQPEFFGF